MISPGREDLAPFEGFKAADFAAWLKVGLEAYLIEDEGVWGFEHVAVFLQGEEHLALALGHIYRELPARKRAKFRKAVAKVMATLEADPVNAPVFEHLLAIAAVLPAPEVLGVLPVRIGNGFFGAMDAEGGRSLFEKTMDAVIDLAAPTEESRACLEMLIGSPNFNIAYSGLALMTLCRVAPRDFVAHMDLLRAPLAKMFEQFGTDEETEKRLAEGIALAVTPAVLAENLSKLHLLERGRGDAEGMWLFRHIVHINEQNVLVVRSLSEPSLMCEIPDAPSKAPVEGRWTGRAGVPKFSLPIADVRRRDRGDNVIYKGLKLFGRRFEEGAMRDPKNGSTESAAYEHTRHA